MAAIRTDRRVLRNCRMIITSTKFENVGEFVTSTVENSTNLLILNRYIRKHIIYKGIFTISFPNTDQPNETGGEASIFPTKPNYALSNGQFKVIAEQAGSEYYCVIPGYVSDRINYSEYILDQGQTHELKRLSLYFIFGTDYKLNDESCTSNKVVACEKSNAILSANTSCKIVQFFVSQTPVFE